MYKSNYQNCEPKMEMQPENQKEMDKSNELHSLISAVNGNHAAVTNQIYKLQKQVNKLTSSMSKNKGRKPKGKMQDNDMKTNAENKNDTYDHYKKESILTNKLKCAICENFPDLPDNSNGEHLISMRNGKDFVLMESCPKWSSLTIPQRHEMLSLAKVCKVCCKLYHDEDKCRYTSRLRYTRCTGQKCKRKYTICKDHMDDNAEKLQNLKKLLNNFHINNML